METLEIMPARVRIAAILRKAIYAGEYRGGDELSLTELAARLGVSRTPVREALQELAADGLITLRMNKGAIVNTIDRKFVRDIFEMRVLLESEAAARAARRGMETEDLLGRLYRMRGEMGSLRAEDYEALNVGIHQSLWRAADNHQLTDILRSLWNGPSVAGGPLAASEHYAKSTEEHIAILEAVRDGDPEQARRAMAGHITRSMENILSLYPDA